MTIASPYHTVNMECIQWNLSITDTLGAEKQLVIQRFTLFGGYFTCTVICFGPAKAVCCREVSLFGEFVIRGSTV